MKDRLLLITGASGGLGTGVVAHLLEAGYTRVVCQYNTQTGKLYDLFQHHGLSWSKHCFQANLTAPNDVLTLHRDIKAQWNQPVWGVFNLAGGSTNSMSWKMSVEEFKDIIDVNLTSTFLTSKQFIPEMREAGGGRIINVSSVVASSGAVGASHYVAAKAGIEGLTRALALELAPKKVTANALALGYFEVGLIEHLTPQLQDNARIATPLKRFGRTRELGNLIEYLFSDDSGFITGQVLHVNGGFHL